MKQFIYYINYILMVEKSREQVSKKKKQTNKQTKNQFFDEKHNTHNSLTRKHFFFRK